MNEYMYDPIFSEATPEDLEFLSQFDDMGFGTRLEELTNFEPTEYGDINNASSAMEWFEFQGYDTNRCAQYAQMFVIEEYTGTKMDMNEFAAIAEQNGWFDEVTGTTLEDMNEMLDYYGIENEASYNNSFEDLVECLDNGERVIVAVDSGEYANGEGFNSDLFDPLNGPDHAIEVIGYDAERQMVIVNDSGNPDGCGEEIPRATFCDAWTDSYNYMITCDR